MSTTTETFYIICRKGNRARLFKEFGNNEIINTGDINEAHTARKAAALFSMLEEYSNRFKGMYEVIGVTETKTIEHKAFDATKELEAWNSNKAYY